MSLVSANVYICKANVYIYKAERMLLYAKKDVNVSCFRLLDIKWWRKVEDSRYVILPSPLITLKFLFWFKKFYNIGQGEKEKSKNIFFCSLELRNEFLVGEKGKKSI